MLKSFVYLILRVPSFTVDFRKQVLESIYDYGIFYPFDSIKFLCHAFWNFSFKTHIHLWLSRFLDGLWDIFIIVMKCFIIMKCSFLSLVICFLQVRKLNPIILLFVFNLFFFCFLPSLGLTEILFCIFNIPF